MMSTRCGTVKKTLLSEYANINKSGLIAISLRDEDELIGVRLTDGNNDIVLVTRAGMSIRFHEEDVRHTGRNTQGVRGILLGDDDQVIGMAPVEAGKNLLVVSERGFGKRTDMDDYRVQNRGGKGLKTYRTVEKTGQLVGIGLVDDDNDIILISDTGVIIRMWALEIPTLARITQGVTLMRTGEGKVVDIAVVEHEITEDMQSFEQAEAEAEGAAEASPEDGEAGEAEQAVPEEDDTEAGQPASAEDDEN